MNILIFSWRGPKHPHAGGAEIVTHEHARYWVANGHKVTLFTSSFECAIGEEYLDGVRILRRGGQVFEVQLRAFFWYLFEQNENYDLVIDHFHGIPFFTPLYIRRPKLAFIHEIAKNVWLHNPWKGILHYLPKTIGKFGEPFVFKFFYKKILFFTVSRSTKNDLLEYGIPKSHITVVNNGIRTMKTRYPKNKTFTIIYLGALAKDKGVEDAIRCFKLTYNEVKSSQLLVIGKGSPDYVLELTNLALKNGIQNNVKFLGFVSEKKKFELLKRSHVLINPSAHEGWGLVNIEANSQGVPVVGYSVSGMVDSVKNNVTGLLVPKGDIKALSKAVLKLHNSKILRDSISKNALKWSSQYNWEQSCKLGLSFIESFSL